MSTNISEMIEKMKKTAATAKTSRERVKTAAPEDLGRGDLLANTIHQMTERNREQFFPEEIKLEKEAAERAKLASAPATKKADDETPAKAEEETKAETTTEATTEEAKEETPAEEKTEEVKEGANTIFCLSH